MSNDVRLFQLNSYVRPKIEESKSKKWVLNGKNNSFYDYIIDQYNGSPTNASIINSFVSLIYGKGLSYRNTQNFTGFVKLATILRPAELKKIIFDYVLFGECAIQVIKKKGGQLSEIAHLPKQNVAPSVANDDNEIESFWYCENWAKVMQNPPEEYSSFGYSNDSIEIYGLKPYRAGNKYFSDPDYISILPYCEIETELANFYLKSIKQGLSAGYIINVPDGNTLTDEEKNEFERQIKAKLTGSPNALNFVLSFNGRDAEITVIPFPVNDQMHKQWDFLTEETTQKILTGHRVTSPAIVGIISSSGFSNTADEMDMAEEQLMRRVISSKQNDIIEAINDILEAYDINLDLYFKPLTENTAIQETTQLSSHVCLNDNTPDEIVDKLIALGEDVSDEWELIDEVEAVDTKLSENMLNAVIQLAVRTPDFDKPRRTESEQDTSIFKIRYKYAGNPNPEREFCAKLMAANKVYRAEDLDKEQKSTPNMGPNGTDEYNLFLYKGGVNCKHFWQRQIYMKKGFKNISVNEARRMILQLDPSERKNAKWEENPKEVAQIASPSNNFWKVN